MSDTVERSIPDSESSTDDSSEGIERSIPESQDKTTDEDAGELRPYEKTAQLSQKFAAVENKTVDDETVLADVKSIDTTKTGGTIAVELQLPAEHDTTNFHMDQPKVWSDHYRFVRFVEKYDYSSGNFEAMIEDDVQVEVHPNDDEDDYELVIPESRVERVKSRWSHVRERISNASGSLISFPVYAGGTMLTYALVIMVAIGFVFRQDTVVYDPSLYTGGGNPMPPLGMALFLGIAGTGVAALIQMMLAWFCEDVLQ